MATSKQQVQRRKAKPANRQSANRTSSKLPSLYICTISTLPMPNALASFFSPTAMLMGFCGISGLSTSSTKLASKSSGSGVAAGGDGDGDGAGGGVARFFLPRGVFLDCRDDFFAHTGGVKVRVVARGRGRAEREDVKAQAQGRTIAKICD